MLLKVLHQTPIDAFSWWGISLGGAAEVGLFSLGLGLCTSNQPLGFWASTCYQASLACQNCRFTVDGGYMMIYAPLMFFGGFDPALIIVWLCMSLLPGASSANIWFTDFEAPHLLEMLLKVGEQTAPGEENIGSSFHVILVWMVNLMVSVLDGKMSWSLVTFLKKCEPILLSNFLPDREGF